MFVGIIAEFCFEGLDEANIVEQSKFNYLTQFFDTINEMKHLPDLVMLHRINVISNDIKLQIACHNHTRIDFVRFFKSLLDHDDFWVNIADTYIELHSCNDIDKKILYIDQCIHIQHYSGSVLDKSLDLLPIIDMFLRMKRKITCLSDYINIGVSVTMHKILLNTIQIVTRYDKRFRTLGI
jgi:hypothetical protein